MSDLDWAGGSGNPRKKKNPGVEVYFEERSSRTVMDGGEGSHEGVKEVSAHTCLKLREGCRAGDKN